MKTASSALVAFLNAARANPDAAIAFADCFTFTLSTGAALTYTNVDQPVLYNGATFSASGPLVQGLKYRATVGLEVDKQQITIAARPTDLVNGAPFLNALRDGAFDGATVQRDRVFMTAIGGAVIGGVTLFHGRVSTIDQVGRTSATVTIASDLVVLDYDMPRNLYSPTCLHTLYDSGCGIPRGTYAASGAVGAGSSATLINFSGAAASHSQGAIVFTSGVNANVRATVKSVAAGASLALIYPLPSTPSPGDGFTVYAGCDHTRATCQSRFNNLGNFRGFPFVPPPQIAY
ncbi:MAG TPA: DUF2163 domain-containing protein [Roseiarcus sp.]|jgi:uncharacterized phage protein (TIGR02218 family)